jgi:hypothetical protein
MGAATREYEREEEAGTTAESTRQHGGSGFSLYGEGAWRTAGRDEDDEEDDFLKLDTYFLHVTFKALMNILRDNSLPSQWQIALSSALRIAQILGPQV